MMKMVFLQGKGSKTIQREPSGVFGEAAVSLARVNRWCRPFKDGNFSVDDEFRSRKPHGEVGMAISQFLSKELFLSARGLVKRPATRPQTIKEILTRDLGMKKDTRR
jgi:hypothetical protein